MFSEKSVFSGLFAGLLMFQGGVALASQTPSAAGPNSGSATQPAPGASTSPANADGKDDDLEAADIDDRFTTEGYVGAYVAGLQSTLPSLGITASIFLDDDFRAGIDLWKGQSKVLFSSFKSQGAGLWSAWELDGRFWLKGGLSYLSLERPTGQDPFPALTKAKDTSDQRPVRTDSIALDASFGQLWTFTKFSIGADYFGFSLPFMTLTGPKQSLFNIHALRVEFLYDID
ncbi:MAG: hypothetical protein RI953_3071 [Pseudomonadota bacterium]|jgi:hypothetical protein